MFGYFVIYRVVFCNDTFTFMVMRRLLAVQTRARRVQRSSERPKVSARAVEARASRGSKRGAPLPLRGRARAARHHTRSTPTRRDKNHSYHSYPLSSSQTLLSPPGTAGRRVAPKGEGTNDSD